MNVFALRFCRYASGPRCTTFAQRQYQPLVRYFSCATPYNMPPKKSEDLESSSGGGKNESHQFQAGSSTHRDEDEWKHRAPYKVHDNDENFDVKWNGKCHCGKVQYQLSRDKPLASKYCHCTTCQRLHGSPFQWATIFHKTDINFTKGHHDLGWYDPTAKDISHHLPCKVSCAFCRTPIMDEGRNMILLFPTLIEGINTKKGREAFAPTCHMFYPERVTDIRDGKVKWKGLDNLSDLMDDDENVLVKFEEGMKQDDFEKKRKRMSNSQKDEKKSPKIEQD